MTVYDVERDAPQLINALGAVDHALRIDHELDEALFNRAAILEKLGLFGAATEAYDVYTRVDRGSKWTADARARRRALASVTRADAWKYNLSVLRRTPPSERATIEKIVFAFPQDARATAEVVLHEEWALAIRSGEIATATRILDLIDSIGSALAARNGDTILHDAAVATRRISDETTRLDIANALIAYAVGRRLYSAERREVAVALLQFKRSANVLRRATHPMADVAEFYHACALFDSDRAGDSLTRLIGLASRVPQSHKSLRAFIAWELGVIHGRAGRMMEALESQMSSLAKFERLGEDGNANVMATQAAASHATFGRRAEAWRIRIGIFRRISRSGDLGDLQRAIDQTARSEAFAGEWENAFSLLSLAADSRLHQNPRIRISTLNWRALAAHRVGIESVVRADLAQASLTSTTIRDHTLRLRAQSETMFCEAVTIRATNPRRAILLLNAYLRPGPSGSSASLAAEALLERGRALAAVGEEVPALRDFRHALALARSSIGRSTSDQLRDAYFRTADSATRELVDALVRSRRVAEAWHVLETQRSRPYTVPSERVPAAPSTPVLQYVVLRDSVLIFVTESGTVAVRRVDAMQNEINRDVEAFVSALDDESGDRLAHRLLLPVASTLRRATQVAIVPDNALSRVPFGALRFEKRRLIERASVTVAPSATVAARARMEIDMASTLLAVGNPAFDRQRFPDLENLPDAEREANVVAREHQNAVVLLGPAATRRRVLEAIDDADMTHFATHAVVAPSEPARSHLLLSPNGADSGILYLSEIERSTLARTRIVVLAGCQTALPGEARRNVDTLALAFLAAGASNVIGTLWNVEDEASSTFTILLYRQLRAGRSPAEATRRVQLAMLASGDASMRDPRAWAAFQAYGS
ncbi:MAG TPA: CHAT domain-containing protein [Thermoanaerobaculia bacterium]